MNAFSASNKDLKFLLKLVLMVIFIIFLFLVYNFHDVFQNRSFLLAYRVQEKTNYNEKHSVCMILTSESTLLTRSAAVWKTWGKHCERALFACNCIKLIKNQEKLRKLLKESDQVPKEFSEYADIVDMPILNLNLTESYNKMGEKVLLVLRLTYEMYASTHKWFFMADDDTYVFVNNLNKFTESLDPTNPFTYGYRYKHKIPPNGYIGGGAGILFTNESMSRLVNKIKNGECDKFLNMYGDVTIGGCANASGILIGNSSDVRNRPRFNYIPPLQHFTGPLPDWLTSVGGTHSGVIGRESCSNESISFHYIKPETMYEIYNNMTILNDLFG